MLHFWTKQRVAEPGNKRPMAIVIDNDDECRRAALRALRHMDITGVGLIETSAAMRMCAGDAVKLCVVPVARYAELANVLAGVAPQDRPIIIVTSAHDDERAPAGVVCVRRPIDADELVATVNRMMRARAARKRVLLVEDDEDLRDIYSTLLEEEGYDVVPAPHGKAAWNAIEAGLKPDLILLDLMMPFMDGHEVYARLQGSALKQTPVVVMTAGGDDEVGDAPVLRKPIDMRRLADIVARAAPAQR